MRAEVITEEFRFLAILGIRPFSVNNGRPPWRSVEEIISSGFVRSSDETARVFAYRIRRRGLAAEFVALVDPKKSSREIIVGHCYVKIKVASRKDIKVDPTGRRIIVEYPRGWIFVTNKEDWLSYQDFMGEHRKKLDILMEIRSAEAEGRKVPTDKEDKGFVIKTYSVPDGKKLIFKKRQSGGGDNLILTIVPCIYVVEPHIESPHPKLIFED